MGLLPVERSDCSPAPAAGPCALDQEMSGTSVGMATFRFLWQRVGWAQVEAAVDSVVYQSCQQMTARRGAMLTRAEVEAAQGTVGNTRR